MENIQIFEGAAVSVIRHVVTSSADVQARIAQLTCNCDLLGLTRLTGLSLACSAIYNEVISPRQKICQDSLRGEQQSFSLSPIFLKLQYTVHLPSASSLRHPQAPHFLAKPIHLQASKRSLRSRVHHYLAALAKIQINSSRTRLHRPTYLDSLLGNSNSKQQACLVDSSNSSSNLNSSQPLQAYLVDSSNNLNSSNRMLLAHHYSETLRRNNPIRSKGSRGNKGGLEDWGRAPTINRRGHLEGGAAIQEERSRYKPKTRFLLGITHLV